MVIDEENIILFYKKALATSSFTASKLNKYLSALGLTVVSVTQMFSAEILFLTI